MTAREELLCRVVKNGQRNLLRWRLYFRRWVLGRQHGGEEQEEFVLGNRGFGCDELFGSTGTDFGVLVRCKAMRKVLIL